MRLAALTLTLGLGSNQIIRTADTDSVICWSNVQYNKEVVQSKKELLSLLLLASLLRLRKRSKT